MKKILLLILIAISSHCMASEADEKDLIARIQKFIAEKDMELLKPTIWDYEQMPLAQVMDTFKDFQILALAGAESMEFTEVYPIMKEQYFKPHKIGDSTYELNVAPYKMLEMRYKRVFKNADYGFSAITGYRDGKLWITGLRKVKE